MRFAGRIIRQGYSRSPSLSFAKLRSEWGPGNSQSLSRRGAVGRESGESHSRIISRQTQGRVARTGIIVQSKRLPRPIRVTKTHTTEGPVCQSNLRPGLLDFKIPTGQFPLPCFFCPAFSLPWKGNEICTRANMIQFSSRRHHRREKAGRREILYVIGRNATPGRTAQLVITEKKHHSHHTEQICGKNAPTLSCNTDILSMPPFLVIANLP